MRTAAVILALACTCLRGVTAATDDLRAYDYEDCPLCDSSVYSYCSGKLLHDACCCDHTDPVRPYQCKFADCSFLHANTCMDHRLITRCCCVRILRRPAGHLTDTSS